MEPRKTVKTDIRFIVNKNQAPKEFFPKVLFYVSIMKSDI